MRDRRPWWRWNRDDVVVLILTGVLVVGVVALLAAAHLQGVI